MVGLCNVLCITNKRLSFAENTTWRVFVNSRRFADSVYGYRSTSYRGIVHKKQLPTRVTDGLRLTMNLTIRTYNDGELEAPVG